MTNRMKTALCALPLMLALLAACAQEMEAKEPEEAAAGLYKTQVQYSGENESTARYLEIAGRSQELLPLLEEHAGAFIMCAYNFQDIDGEGTPLYAMNGMDWPVEIDPAGMTVQVSPNYFVHNPIQTVDGGGVAESLIDDDMTLNVLVPERYRDMEEDIIAAHRENFWFEKVQAANDYNEMAGLEERLEIAPEELEVHIIYVKDGQRYFTFRSDCAVETGGWVTDPIVEVYTGNTHSGYAHSYLSQWLYFPYEGDAQAAYAHIAPYVEQVGAQDSVRQVIPADRMEG